MGDEDPVSLVAWTDARGSDPAIVASQPGIARLRVRSVDVAKTSLSTA